MSKRRTFISVVIMVWVALFSLSKATAESDYSSAEYAIKAAFLYNLTKFVEWPPEVLSNTDSFCIAILGRDPFGETIDVLQNKEVRGRKIVVQRVTTLENLGRCHILFISNSENDRIRSILERLRNRPILIVGESDDFARQGGMISLVKRENKVKLEINPKAAEQSGLKISSHLLKLATIVESR